MKRLPPLIKCTLDVSQNSFSCHEVIKLWFFHVPITNPTTYIISGRVKVRYLRLPMRLLNNVRFTDFLFESIINFILASTLVLIGLHASVRNSLNICSAYFFYDIKIPSSLFLTSTPRKYDI